MHGVGNSTRDDQFVIETQWQTGPHVPFLEKIPTLYFPKFGKEDFQIKTQVVIKTQVGVGLFPLCSLDFGAYSNFLR